MRVLLRRQVQRAVGRIQVAMPTRAVRDPVHTDLPEHRRKRPPMPYLNAAATHPVRAHNLIDPALLLGA